MSRPPEQRAEPGQGLAQKLIVLGLIIAGLRHFYGDIVLGYRHSEEWTLYAYVSHPGR